MMEIIREQECCYLSTPEHTRSFVGRFTYIYTGKGSLLLTTESLKYFSKKVTIDIPLGAIVGFRKGTYPRTAKPIRLGYIEIIYRTEGGEDTILLTPAKSWTTPVWKSNEHVTSWLETLEQAIGSVAR